jgi:hypothetical protein
MNRMWRTTSAKTQCRCNLWHDDCGAWQQAATPMRPLYCLLGAILYLNGARYPSRHPASGETIRRPGKVTVSGCLRPEAPGEYLIEGDDGKTYEIMNPDPEIRLDDHVYRKVTVTGIARQAGVYLGEADEKGQAIRYLDLHVTAVKKTGDTCY